MLVFGILVRDYLLELQEIISTTRKGERTFPLVAMGLVGRSHARLCVSIT